MMLTGISCLQAGPQPLSLRLKPNQNIKQLTTTNFDIYLDFSEDFIEQIKKETASQQPEETALLHYGLSQLRKDKPACSCSMQTTRTTKVLDDHEQYYSVSFSNRCDRFTLQENLLNNFTIVFNAEKPEKNFSNLPIPVDFSEIDQIVNMNETITCQIAKDGTVVGIDNIHQLVMEKSTERGWSKEFTTQMSLGIGFGSLLIPQLKVATVLTGMRLSDTPRKVGEVWSQPFVTVPPMIEPAIPEEYLPMLKLLDQKITFLENKDGFAKFSIEFPAEESQRFTMPDKEAFISFNGSILKGKIKIDTSTGLIADAEFISDFSVAISRIKEDHPAEQDVAKSEITFRIVANTGIETHSNP